MHIQICMWHRHRKSMQVTLTSVKALCFSPWPCSVLPAIVPDFIILVLSTWSICIRWGTTKEAFSLGNKKNKSSTFFCGCWSIRIDHPKTWNAVVVTQRYWEGSEEAQRRWVERAEGLWQESWYTEGGKCWDTELLTACGTKLPLCWRQTHYWAGIQSFFSSFPRVPAHGFAHIALTMGIQTYYRIFLWHSPQFPSFFHHLSFSEPRSWTFFSFPISLIQLMGTVQWTAYNYRESGRLQIRSVILLGLTTNNKGEGYCWIKCLSCITWRQASFCTHLVKWFTVGSQYPLDLPFSRDPTLQSKKKPVGLMTRVLLDHW